MTDTERKISYLADTLRSECPAYALILQQRPRPKQWELTKHGEVIRRFSSLQALAFLEGFKVGTHRPLFAI